MIAGAVLCGGRSSRMGVDKATLQVGGAPLAARAVAALRGAGADPVVTVGGDPALAGQLGTGHVADRGRGAGPVVATGTALAALHWSPLVVVAACDLVGPRPDAVRRLVEALQGDSRAAAAVALDAGRAQWQLVAWRPAAAGAVAGIRATERGPGPSFASATAELEVVRVEGLDPDALRDADRPEELRDVGRVPFMVPEIDVLTLQERLSEGAPLVDVREPDEYLEARVAGGSLIPLGEIVERAEEIPAEGTVYVICARGGRSAKAVEHLRRVGIDAVNVAGGTLGWIEAGLPTESGSA